MRKVEANITGAKYIKNERGVIMKLKEDIIAKWSRYDESTIIKENEHNQEMLQKDCISDI